MNVNATPAWMSKTVDLTESCKLRGQQCAFSETSSTTESSTLASEISPFSSLGLGDGGADEWESMVPMKVKLPCKFPPGLGHSTGSPMMLDGKQDQCCFSTTPVVDRRAAAAAATAAALEWTQNYLTATMPNLNLSLPAYAGSPISSLAASPFFPLGSAASIPHTPWDEIGSPACSDAFGFPLPQSELAQQRLLNLHFHMAQEREKLLMEQKIQQEEMKLQQQRQAQRLEKLLQSENDKENFQGQASHTEDTSNKQREQKSEHPPATSVRPQKKRWQSEEVIRAQAVDQSDKLSATVTLPLDLRMKQGSRFTYTVVFPGHDIDLHHDFELVPRLIGRKGENMHKIVTASNGKVRIRGRGSGHCEVKRSNVTQEADIPLQIALSCSSFEGLQRGVAQLDSLLQVVAGHFARYCRSKGFDEVPQLYCVDTTQ